MNRKGQEGFALITVLLMVAVIVAMLGAYFTLTGIELSTTESSMDSMRGFYAAEAGSNARADLVRDIFLGYNRPVGTSPIIGGVEEPCTGTNKGADDFACSAYNFGERSIDTYVIEPAGNPSSIVIPRGEKYQNLNAQEYRYVVHSESGSSGALEAAVEMRFKSRLVPLFQFAVFYNKDLEILPGPDMNLGGPVHSNGDLYLGSDNALDIHGQVTSAADIYHGRKNEEDCMNGGVSVIDPESLLGLPACTTTRVQLDPGTLGSWNDMILSGVDPLIVPPPEILDPIPGEQYWDLADIRIMLNLNGATPEIEVRNSDGTKNTVESGVLDGCGAVGHSNSFYNNREGAAIEMLDVDAVALLDCLHTQSLLGVGTDIDEISQGGLVWYLGVDGPDSGAVNNYGVRVLNGSELASSEIGAPDIQGLTVATSQGVYVQGSYNSTNKKPAAFLADSINVLSNAWDDSTSTMALSNRKANATTVYAAFLGGTDSTGAVEGPAGQDIGLYNGGVENYPRFHESWSGVTLIYRGSFVSLNLPRHVDGAWAYGSPYYEAPTRNWGYDPAFNTAGGLPPLSPRFVYLRQELFVRQFDF